MADERELRVFLHLARTLNFGRTSLDCHLSPATLTRMVQRLETRVGHRLFDRGPTGVSMTAEGRRFREYAVSALDLWDSYRRGDPDPVELTGRLTVFATVTACHALLPDLLTPFRRAHPQVRVDLRTGDAAAALARVDEGEADAAVAVVPARLPEPLVCRTVTSTDLVFVTARDRRDDDLTGPFVLPSRGLVREAADRWFRGRGAYGTAYGTASEADGHEALLTLVALGYGTGIVPRIVLDASALRGRLAIVPADPPPASLSIGLCVRRADLRRPLVAALWSLTN